MKILQINNCHYRRGGADVVYLNTGQLLQKHGHLVVNFSQKNPMNLEWGINEYFINQIDFFKHSMIRKILNIPRFLYSSEAKNKLEKLIQKEKPDIAHIHFYKGTITPSILIPLKRYMVPTIITLHDYGLLCPHNSFLNGERKICEKCLISNNPLNCIFNRCNRNNIFLSAISAFEYIIHEKLFPFKTYFDKLIVVSKFGEEIHLRKKGYLNKVIHIYNFFPDLDQTIPEPMKGQYFLFYGRISYEKGLMTLLQAWKNFNSNSILKIVGDGPQKSEIISYIQENKIQKTEIIGFKTGKELEDIIRNSSFIIVPSECYENNPLTIIEAYAYGKPVIASKTGGIPEIVVENKTGFLFEMGNSEQLTRYLRAASNMQNEQYSLFSRNAREFAEDNFSEEIHYKRLLDMYNDVILKTNEIRFNQ